MYRNTFATVDAKQGFTEFDLKYDRRDKKYKVLEINVRQGRFRYYIVSLRFNLIKMLVDDFIYHKTENSGLLTQKALPSFIPIKVAKRYIKNEKYIEQIDKMLQGKEKGSGKGVINPLDYPKDKNLKRFLFLQKSKSHFADEYKNGYWENEA